MWTDLSQFYSPILLVYRQPQTSCRLLRKEQSRPRIRMVATSAESGVRVYDN